MKKKARKVARPLDMSESMYRQWKELTPEDRRILKGSMTEVLNTLDDPCDDAKKFAKNRSIINAWMRCDNAYWLQTLMTARMHPLEYDYMSRRFDHWRFNYDDRINAADLFRKKTPLGNLVAQVVRLQASSDS